MKLLVTLLPLLIGVYSFSFIPSEKGDPVKTKIENLEKQLFGMPIDQTLDTGAIYVSLYEYSCTSKINKCHKKEQTYRKNNSDTLIMSNLIRINDQKNAFKDIRIVSRDDVFDHFKNHMINCAPFQRYIIGFNNDYLVIRTGSVISITDSMHTGPSYFREKYVYYKRVIKNEN